MNIKVINGNVLLRKIEDLLKNTNLIYERNFGENKLACEVIGVADDCSIDIKVGDRVIVDKRNLYDVFLGFDYDNLYIINELYIDNVLDV